MNLADKSAPAPAATSGGADKEAQDPRKNFNYALVKVNLASLPERTVLF